MEGLSLKEAAKEYVAHGLYVAPLWPGSKEPIRGFAYDMPSKEPERVRYWWDRCEDANIALPTGIAYNSLIVIDLDSDGKVNGSDTLHKFLLREGLTFPETATAQSGGGGLHLYFKNDLHIKIESCKDIIPGIDILSEGAHVVAPPSVHPSGRAYKWQIGPERLLPADDNVYTFLKLLGLC